MRPRITGSPEIARTLCRVFGHRIYVRIYMRDRVGALQCLRCLALTRLPPPGFTDEQIDESGVPVIKSNWAPPGRGW
jgi:hypothetical protein